MITITPSLEIRKPELEKKNHLLKLLQIAGGRNRNLSHRLSTFPVNGIFLNVCQFLPWLQ